MSSSITIVLFVCLPLFFARTSECSGNTEKNDDASIPSPHNYSGSKSTVNDENQDQELVSGSKSTVNDESSTSTVNDRYTYKQCLTDVTKVFPERNSPKENFLFAFTRLDDVFFRRNPTYGEAFSYFEALIDSINWGSIDLWGTKDYCYSLYEDVEHRFTRILLMNGCLMDLQELSYSGRKPANELFIKFYKNEIFGQIHITHDLDPEIALDEVRIRHVQGYYNYLYEQARAFIAEQFPSIQEHCNKYPDEIINVLENLAIEDVD